MAIGYFNSNGDPCVEIEVSNPLNWKQKLNCVIDTGFSGFLSIPIFQAFPIGLLLTGTVSVRLADGSIQYKLTCLGHVFLDGDVRVGVIMIEPRSEQVLLGMDFLRIFGRKLLVDPINRTVEIVPASPSSPSYLPTQLPPAA